MTAHFNWHNLPSDMRLGSAPDDMLTLYRGYAPHQLDPIRGFLSSAEENGAHQIVEDAIAAVEINDIYRLIGYIADHSMGFSKERRGVLTPFIYATSIKDTAMGFARREGERVATIEVLANRVTIEPMTAHPLVLGSISLAEIVAVEDGLSFESQHPPTGQNQYHNSRLVVPLEY